MHSKTDGPADNVTICFFPSGRKNNLKTKQKNCQQQKNSTKQQNKSCGKVALSSLLMNF